MIPVYCSPCSSLSPGLLWDSLAQLFWNFSFMLIYFCKYRTSSTRHKRSSGQQLQICVFWSAPASTAFGRKPEGCFGRASWIWVMLSVSIWNISVDIGNPFCSSRFSYSCGPIPVVDRKHSFHPQMLLFSRRSFCWHWDVLVPLQVVPEISTAVPLTPGKDPWYLNFKSTSYEYCLANWDKVSLCIPLTCSPLHCFCFY